MCFEHIPRTFDALCSYSLYFLKSHQTRFSVEDDLLGVRMSARAVFLTQSMTIALHFLCVRVRVKEEDKQVPFGLVNRSSVIPISVVSRVPLCAR